MILPPRMPLAGIIGVLVSVAMLVGVAEPQLSPAPPFPVAMRVDASRSSGPLKPIWRFFGADEPNYAYMKDGQKLLGELGDLAPEQVFFRTHNLLTLRRRHAGAEMGLHQRLPRRRRRQPRSTTGRSSTASSTRTCSAACGRTSQIGFMPKDLSIKPEPYQHTWTPTAKYEEIYTGWAYPPKDYDEVGRTGLPVGEALRRTLRPRRSGELVLGSLERSQHRLLARHAGRVSQAARLRHRRRAPRAADGARRRARHGRRTAASSRATSSSTAFAEPTTPPASRDAARLRFVPCQGRPTFVDGHVRMGIANQLTTIDDGLPHRSRRFRN